MNLISEGCPINKLYQSMSTKVYRSMSNKLYQRVIHKYYRSMSNKLYWRLTNEFSKTKIFCFENGFFSYIANACVRELARTRGMGHGM